MTLISRRLAVLSIVGLLALTGCSSSMGSPAPTETSSRLGEIESVEQLRDAFVAAGGDCDDWKQNNKVSRAAESGDCSSRTVLMMFETPGERDETVFDLEGLTLPGEERILLVGRNWIINSPDVKGMEDSIGGTVRATTGATPTPEPEVSQVSRQEFSGTGDMVQDIGNFTELAAITFRCDSCSRNVQLKSNGDESLIVNEIGAYAGSHLINLYDNSMTTRFEIVADGAWSLVIDDISTLQRFSGVATGTGDTAFIMDGAFTAAEILNDGDSNFQVFAYGSGSSSPMLVNEIGAYSGVRPMTGPALVQVISSGTWSITPR